MTMAVYGGVAVVGQAVKSPSDTMAMIICMFIVVPVWRLYSTMSVEGGNGVNPARFVAFPLDVVARL